MDQLIKQYYKKFELENYEIYEKALECNRLLQVSASLHALSQISLHQHSISVICLDIACKYYRIDLDRKLCARFCGLSKTKYMKGFVCLQNILTNYNENENLQALNKFIIINNYGACDQQRKQILEILMNSHLSGKLNTFYLNVASLYIAIQSSNLPLNMDKFYEIHKLDKNAFYNLINLVKQVYDESVIENDSQPELESDEDIPTYQHRDYEALRSRMMSQSYHE